MNFSKTKLLSVLEACMPGINDGASTVVGMDQFTIKNGRVITYNDLVSVSASIEQEAFSEVKGSFKASDFVKVLKKIKEETIDFEAGEKVWKFKFGRASVEVNLLHSETEAIIDCLAPSDDGWNELSADFLEGVNVCRMEKNKTKLNGIFFSGNRIVSSDGYTINDYTVKCELPTFFISENSIKELVKFKKVCRVKVEKGWVFFGCDDATIFATKTLNAAGYPITKIDSCFVDLDTDGLNSYVFPTEFFEAVNRSVGFASEENNNPYVNVRFDGTKIEIETQKTSGKYTENVDWDKAPATDDEVNFSIYADTISFIAKWCKNFYLIKRDVSEPSLLFFTTESSRHLFATLIVDK